MDQLAFFKICQPILQWWTSLALKLRHNQERNLCLRFRRFEIVSVFVVSVRITSTCWHYLLLPLLYFPWDQYNNNNNTWDFYWGFIRRLNLFLIEAFLLSNNNFNLWSCGKHPALLAQSLLSNAKGSNSWILNYISVNSSQRKWCRILQQMGFPSQMEKRSPCSNDAHWPELTRSSLLISCSCEAPPLYDPSGYNVHLSCLSPPEGSWLRGSHIIYTRVILPLFLQLWR